MEGNSDKVKILKKMDEQEITDLEVEVKKEKMDETRNIKTEVFEQTNYSEPLQIIGEKRKNQEILNLENKKIKEEIVLFEELDDKQSRQDKPENRKIKEEFVVFRKLNDQQEIKQEPQEIEEINLKVIRIIYILPQLGLFWS
jgi:hypothetical protein